MRAHFLLTLHYAGQVFRLATDTLEVATEGGERLLYVDALDDVEWEETLELFGDAPGMQSVPFEVVLPGMDVAQLVADGHDLATMTGELALWEEGDTFEARRVLLVGRAAEPTYGAPGEPVTFSLESNPWDDRSTVLDPGALVDATTWPNADEKEVGHYYPFVVGTPGKAGPEATDQIRATPGVVVDPSNRTLLIAGHVVDAIRVYVADLDVDDSSFRWGLQTVLTTTDGRGRDVSTVQLGTVGNAAYVDGHRYAVMWAGGLQGGGHRRPDGLSPMLTAGEALHHHLSRSSQDVDLGRLEAVIDDLQRYKVGYYIDDPAISHWEWVQANLLPILPVSIVAGPRGLYPIVWRWWATAADAVAHLDTADRLVERAGPVEYTSRSGVANEIRVLYALDDASGDYKRSYVVHGDPSQDDRPVGPRGEEARPGYHLDHLCRVSHGRYGRAVDVVETDIVYDAGTAAAIAAWRARAKALPARVLTYETSRLDHGHLERGDVVTLTDDELALEEQLCFVEGIRHGEDTLILTLRTLEERGRG